MQGVTYKPSTLISKIVAQVFWHCYLPLAPYIAIQSSSGHTGDHYVTSLSSSKGWSLRMPHNASTLKQDRKCSWKHALAQAVYSTLATRLAYCTVELYSSYYWVHTDLDSQLTIWWWPVTRLLKMLAGFWAPISWMSRAVLYPVSLASAGMLVWVGCFKANC